MFGAQASGEKTRPQDHRWTSIAAERALGHRTMFVFEQARRFWSAWTLRSLPTACLCNALQLRTIR